MTSAVDSPEGVRVSAAGEVVGAALVSGARASADHPETSAGAPSGGEHATATGAPERAAESRSGTTPEGYASDFQVALSLADHGKLRSIQTAGGLLGASDAGGCPQKAVYTVKHTAPSDVVKTGRAKIGTALHQVFLAQIKDLYPERIIEAELTVTLPSGAQILVHPDEIDPSEPSVTDLKTVADLDYRRKIGVSDQHRMQRSLYALAAIQAGLVPEQGLVVRNAYLSMTDADDMWIQQEPFSMEWVERADEWFAEVQYAVLHDEDARRDAQPHFCANWCPFYTTCRPPLVDAMGELTSPALREAVLVGREAVEQRKYYEKLEAQTKTLLHGVSGRVGSTQVVSTWCNSGKGYYRTDFRELS